MISICFKVRILFLYYQYETAIKLLEMSENIYAYFIAIIIGKISIPETGLLQRTQNVDSQT